jgi:predicted Zn-dependent protease
VEASPGDARAHEYRSLALEQTGRIEEAEAALEEALLLEPESSDLQVARASLLLKLGKLAESKQIVTSLKESLPEDQQVLVLEGRIALLENKPGEAASIFETAFLKSQSNLLLLDLVNARFRAGQREEALKTMEEWLTDNPEDSLIWHRRAEYLMALERWSEARASYEAVLAYEPDDARALNNLAWVKMELGETESALAMARKAATLAPQNLTVNDTLAMALLRAGQEQEAVDLLRSITRSAPDDKTLRYHLAQALSATGKVEEAVNELQGLLGDSTPFRERAEAEALLASLTQ